MRCLLLAVRTNLVAEGIRQAVARLSRRSPTAAYGFLHARRSGTWLRLYTPDAPRRLQLPLGVMVTDLDTEHGGTEANKRDVARQVGRLNVR